MRTGLLVVALGVLLTSVGTAGIIDGQFTLTSQQYSGPAIVGSDGDYWNYFDQNYVNFGPVALLDSSGSATAVTLAASGWDPHYQANISAPPNGFYGGPYQWLMYGTAAVGFGTSASLTFGGLDPNTQYDFYLYSDWDYNFALDREADVNANGTLSHIGPGDPIASTFIQGQNYIQMTPTTDAFGALTVTIFNVASQEDITGFQLASAGTPLNPIEQTTPEPSSALLLGSVLLVGMGVWRRLA